VILSNSCKQHFYKYQLGLISRIVSTFVQKFQFGTLLKKFQFRPNFWKSVSIRSFSEKNI